MRGQHVQLELHPPRFKVLLLTDGPAEKTDSPSHKYVTLSARDTVKTLCNALAKAVSPTSGFMGPYRVWAIDPSNDDVDFNYKQYPALKLDTSVHKVVDQQSLQEIDDVYEPEYPFVVEFKGDHNWIIDVADDKKPPVPLFNSNDGFFNKMSGNSVARPSTALTTFGSKSAITSATTGKSLNGGVGKAMEPGTLGLGNM